MPMFATLSDPVIIAAIAAVSSAVASLFAYLKANSTHKLVNSRMTELLALAQKASRAEGVIEGTDAEKARTNVPIDTGDTPPTQS